MALTVTHEPVAGPNDPTKQVSKTVYEAPHVIAGDYLRKATVTLSSAQILDLHNTPVTLVAAPGAAKAVLPWRVVHHFRYGTAAYVADTPGNEPRVSISPQENSEYDLLNRDADADYASIETTLELYENSALSAVITGGGYYVTGDGTLTVTVWYTVEDVP